MRFTIESDGKDVKITSSADCGYEMMVNTLLSTADYLIEELNVRGNRETAEKLKNAMANEILQMGE